MKKQQTCCSLGWQDTPGTKAFVSSHEPDMFPPGIKLSAAWARHPLECTKSGLERCRGMCCRHWRSWPPNSSHVEGADCPLPTTQGGALGEARPLLCILTPFSINRNGTLCLMRTAWKGACQDNWHREGSPTILEALAPSWRMLFGGQIDGALDSVRQGKDWRFEVHPEMWEQLKKEHYWSLARQLPFPRDPVFYWGER